MKFANKLFPTPDSHSNQPRRSKLRGISLVEFNDFIEASFEEFGGGPQMLAAV